MNKGFSVVLSCGFSPQFCPRRTTKEDPAPYGQGPLLYFAIFFCAIALYAFSYPRVVSLLLGVLDVLLLQLVDAGYLGGRSTTGEITL